jgi:hypothetical protein
MDTKLNDRMRRIQSSLEVVRDDLKTAKYTKYSYSWKDSELFQEVRDVIRRLQDAESITEVC